MAQQIIFFEKNKADLSKSNVSITASQGSTYVDYMRNRSNRTAWITTGSVDADNTYIEIDFADAVTLTDIILLKHNFKAYTIQYWTGLAYTDFSTAISETSNSDVNKHHNFDSVITTKIKLTITGTMVADDDKYLYQFIATDRIGQLESWAIVKSKLSRNRQKSTMLSGKMSIREKIGAFSGTASVKIVSSDADLTIIEKLFESNSGFLYWACGGDETQYRTERKGYRMEDIYLVKCVNEWQADWYKGLYQTGMKVDLKLQEVID